MGAGAGEPAKFSWPHTEVRALPAIVEFPHVVRQVMDEFSDQFYGEPQRRHFGEYLAGLLVASNKTVTGINSEFVKTTDQSCLNRFLTSANWDTAAVNA